MGCLNSKTKSSPLNSVEVEQTKIKSIEQRRSIYGSNSEISIKQHGGTIEDIENFEKEGEFTSIDVNKRNQIGTQFDWKMTCELETPNYVSYICARQDSSFLVCADNSIHVFAVGRVVEPDHAQNDDDLEKLQISHLQSVQCYEDKVVNQCCMIDQYRVITCGRDPTIKILDLEHGAIACELSGHEMSVSSVSYNKGKVVSGGRDCTTRVWDVESAKTICKRQIDRNLVTQNRWICSNTFVQTSEDLNIRIFDIREKPLKPSIQVKVGTNFATTCDMFEQRLMVTGHRGFNGSGAEVKHWDLKKLSEPIFVFQKHQFTPETVRFIGSMPTTVSASKDSYMHIIDEQGNSIASERQQNAFACMDTLKVVTPFSDSTQMIVCADIKQDLMIYTYDEKRKFLKLN